MSDCCDCIACLCTGICSLFCAISSCGPAGGGTCMCLRSCRKRSDEDSDDANSFDMDHRDIAVQPEPAFNAQPPKTGRMNPNLAPTEVIPTG